ncbi:helicase [Cyanobium sp. ULC084]|nr:MAG: helicase [Cyanobium sp.]
MLEARAHHQLKHLLRQEGGGDWPHHLTLCRLVGRSLRRADHTLIRLAAGSDPNWLVGLMVPLAMGEVSVALVATEAMRRRLLQVELPRLRAAGLALSCWEGEKAPEQARLWLLSHEGLLRAWQSGELGARQLVFPEAELVQSRLREALEINLESSHWEQLRRCLPAADSSLLALHERLSRRILSQPATPSNQVAVAPEDEAPLRQLLRLLGPLPDPWPAWMAADDRHWTSWATVDRRQLQWRLHRQPLEPLEVAAGLLDGRGTVVVGLLGKETGLPGITPKVVVDLAEPPLADPLPLYVPWRQPLPNSPHYSDHLLDHSRRLVLAQTGLSIVLVEDASLRLTLASGLAAEFGSRVVHQNTAPASNGVICCSWGWWLDHQNRLPLPCQVIVGPLPISSLEEPLTAARVANLRQQGRDWFRELLLPEAVLQLQRASASLRRATGRLALLDGRVRSRSWGQQVLTSLEPWVELSRLLPT